MAGPILQVESTCGRQGPGQKRDGKLVFEALRRGVVVFGLAAAASVVAADEGSVVQGGELPKGLESYLEARILEANGRFRDALDAYEKAVREAPDVNEIRLAYASFLVNVSMANRAVDLLDEGEDLGPEGLRVKALALAQLADRNPDLVEKTEAALREAIVAGENDSVVLFSLAQILLRQNKSAEAEEIIAGLREDRPSSQRLTMAHADVLRASGRLEEAAELYTLCSVGGPFAPTCRENLVAVLVELDRPGEAGERMLEWLGDLDLDSLMRAAGLLWESGRYDLSLETVQRVLVRAPDSVRAQTLEAHLLSNVGRHEEAMDRLHRLLKKDPENVDLMLAIAWSTSRSGRHEKEGRTWLERAWTQAQESGDSNQEVRCALTAARLELIADKPMVARGWLDRVDDVETAGADYVRLLAETFRRQEQWEEGISALVRIQPRLGGRAQVEAEALEAEFLLRTGDSRAWRRLRPILDSDQPSSVLLGLQILQLLERWEDVERETASAIERIGEGRDLLFTRAAALERIGRLEESEELFRRLVDQEPDDANAANYLGYMWADRDVNLDEALELIARAVALDPENSAFLDSLGWVHYRLGDIEQAEHWLRRAIDLGGDLGDGTVYCHLGEVLLVNGQTDEGRRYLLQGLDLGCEDSEHVQELLEQTDDQP
jgi:tetratricopeptide (TPR) repeat protein